MSALDNYLRNHKDFCHNHEYPSGNCFCGRNEAAAELTKLRAERDVLAMTNKTMNVCNNDLLHDVDRLTLETIHLRAAIATSSSETFNAVRVIAQLRAEVGEARKVIENYSDCTDLDDCFSADPFLKKYPKENK